MKTIKTIVAAALLLLSISLTVHAQTAVTAGDSGTYSGVTNNVPITTTNTSPVPNLTYLDFGPTIGGILAPNVYLWATTQCGATTNLTALGPNFLWAKSPDGVVWTTNRFSGMISSQVNNGASDVTSLIAIDMKGCRYLKLAAIEKPTEAQATNYVTNITVKYSVK